jgi:Holliday junction resolvase RusA-like endonuclease
VSALLIFEVPGPPLPWQRAKSYKGRRLTPKNQRAYQQRIQWSAIAVMPDRSKWPLDARYSLEIDAYVTPKQRNDLDNLIKQVGDAGNGVLWADDRRIDAIAIRRHIEREKPRLVIRVATLSAYGALTRLGGAVTVAPEGSE